MRVVEVSCESVLSQYLVSTLYQLFKFRKQKNSKSLKNKTNCQFMFLRQSFVNGSLTLRNFLVTSQVTKRKWMLVSK